ncbi:glycosyltransferase family 2 protein [Sanguibacter hominis ATCC BAA-789]|uniref:Glycosyltransferase family 2 protein n=1 Tax=Sanguibacter hominis ATCC BAA-789 TaxID=1312740 RepID=A0A9X5FCE1_9MICO|nr:glycosyltransferase family A protein [Sanguibacter hominis]NKX93595.1 glycosyltransferase family 2 protein [Sanguibacter hominis ATCC BAA-789]
MNPRVSIVVPAYNNGAVIAETLSSILAQTWQDLDIVVADHASTDDTLSVIQRFAATDERIRVFSTPAGGGALRNWNRVTELAQGELIKLVCGDDVLYPTIVEEQVAEFDKASAEGRPVVLVASQRDLIDTTGSTFVRARGLGALDGRTDGKVALRATVRAGGNLFGEPACVLLRRETLVAAGGWHDLRYYLDLGGYAGVLAAGDMIALRRPLAAFRVGGGQWSVRLAGQQAADAARFHRIAQGLAPDVITDTDVRMGDWRAKILALQRRAAYGFLSARAGLRSSAR